MKVYCWKSVISQLESILQREGFQTFVNTGEEDRSKSQCLVTCMMEKFGKILNGMMGHISLIRKDITDLS